MDGSRFQKRTRGDYNTINYIPACNNAENVKAVTDHTVTSSNIVK
jgi:quinolinate synthase